MNGCWSTKDDNLLRYKTMPNERQRLEPDADAVEKWERLPHNTPSKDALPPMTGGRGIFSLKWLLILFAIAVIVGLIVERGPF